MPLRPLSFNTGHRLVISMGGATSPTYYTVNYTVLSKPFLEGKRVLINENLAHLVQQLKVGQVMLRQIGRY